MRADRDPRPYRLQRIFNRLAQIYQGSTFRADPQARFAKECGPNIPHGVTRKGAGDWLIFSHLRQETFPDRLDHLVAGRYSLKRFGDRPEKRVVSLEP